MSTNLQITTTFYVFLYIGSVGKPKGNKPKGYYVIMGVKIIVLILGAGGVANLKEAVMADVGVQIVTQ